MTFINTKTNQCIGRLYHSKKRISIREFRLVLQYNTYYLRDRITVVRIPLEDVILVRIQVPQQVGSVTLIIESITRGFTVSAKFSPWFFHGPAHRSIYLDIELLAW